MCYNRILGRFFAVTAEKPRLDFLETDGLGAVKLRPDSKRFALNWNHLGPL